MCIIVRCVFYSNNYKRNFLLFLFQLMKLTRTKDIVVIPLILSMIFSLLISNSISNQQVIAQDVLFGEPPQQSPIQSLENAGLVYESPTYEIRTQYPDGWEII